MREAIKAAMGEGKKVIDPRTSEWTQWWDLIIVTLLVVVLFLTPYEVAFLPPRIDVLFGVNRVFDLIFFCDMVRPRRPPPPLPPRGPWRARARLAHRASQCPRIPLVRQPNSPRKQVIHCFTCYQLGPKHDHRWVKDLPSIRYHYMRGWFTVDLLSIMPWWIPPLFATGEGDVVRAVSGARLLRLLKLSRVLGLSTIIKRYETRMDIAYATISMYKLFFLIVAWAHLQACVWGLVVTFEDERCAVHLARQTCAHMPHPWFTTAHIPRGVSVGLSPPAASPHPAPHPCSSANTWIDALAESLGADSRHDVTPWATYVASLYWSVMTLTSIGYGAMLPPDDNTTEHFVCTLLMMFSSLFWIYLTGQVCAIASNMDQDTADFHNSLDQLNLFMRTRELKQDLRVRLRSYFHSSRDVRRVCTDALLLERMSPLLRGTVALEAHRNWLDRVWYLSIQSLPEDDFKLRTEQEAFISHLAMRLQPFAYVREERVPIGSLYILQKGLVSRGFVFLGPGRVWGYDMLLQNQHRHLINRTASIALTYIEVITLSRDDLMDCAEEFPEAERRIRAARARMLMAKVLTKHVRSVLAPQKAERPVSAVNGLSTEALSHEMMPRERKLQRARSAALSVNADDAALNEAVRSAVSSALREALPEGSLQALSAELASLRAALASQSNDVPLPAELPDRRSSNRPSGNPASVRFATPAKVDALGC